MHASDQMTSHSWSSASQNPILIFDSGFGGLSVLRYVMNAFPERHIHYLADDAFFPFGDKEPDQIRARLLDLLPAYVERIGARLLVVACNTGYLLAGETLAASLPIPVFGCSPPLWRAGALSQSKLVSVIATRNTIAELRKQAHAFPADCHFILIPSDDLAPAIEDLVRGDETALERAKHELLPCFVEREGRQVDVIVLGCSHYPLLGDRLQEIAPWAVTFIDSAETIFQPTKRIRPPGYSKPPDWKSR